VFGPNAACAPVRDEPVPIATGERPWLPRAAEISAEHFGCPRVVLPLANPFLRRHFCQGGLEPDEPLLLIPFATRWAFIRLAETLGGQVTPKALKAAILASRLEVSAWHALLAGLTQVFGVEAVANALGKLKNETMLGLQRVRPTPAS